MFSLGIMWAFVSFLCLFLTLFYSVFTPSLIGILWLLISMLLILHKNEKLNIFSPFLITVFTISFCFGLIPLYLLFSGRLGDLEILRALIFIIIFVLSFAIGYCLRIGGLLTSKIPPFSDRWSKIKLKIVCCIAIIGGILGYISLLYLSGFMTNPLQVFKNPLLFRWKIENYGVTYIKFLTFYSLSVPLFLLLVKLFRNELKERKRILFFIFIYFIFYEALAFTTGSRGAVIVPILSIGVMYSYLRRPIPLRYLFLIIPVFSLTIIIFSIFYLNYRTVGVGNISVSLNAKQAFLYFLDRFSDSFEGLTILISKYESNHSFLYGRSLADFLCQPIPRNLWPAKPYHTSVLLTEQFLPHVFEANVTYEFSFIGELFINFHFVGFKNKK